MKSNFKILIVDDEVLIAEFLKHVLASFGYGDLQLAHNKQEAISKLNTFKPDLVLLDIRMETELEGIEIATEINNNFKTPFLFVTSHTDTAIVERSLNTNPAGYLTKPIKKADVLAAVQIIEKKKQNSATSFLVIKDGYDNIKIPLDDILYVKSEGHYIDIHTKTKKYTLRNSLEWFVKNTPDDIFYRCHRSVVVNKKLVTRSSSKSVFIGDLEIPVSRNNRFKIN
ncbi:MAG: LytR/AlgR family response regulator transcription factor [Bacteroidia bacterium]